MTKSMVFDTSVALDVIKHMLDIKSNKSFSVKAVMEYLGENKMILPTSVVQEIEEQLQDYPEKTEEYESLWDSKLDEIEIKRHDCEIHKEGLLHKLEEITENPTGKVATNWINLKKSELNKKKINVREGMTERKKAIRRLKRGIRKDIRILSQVMKYSEDHNTVLITNDGDMVVMVEYYLKSKKGLHLSIWRPQKVTFGKKNQNRSSA